MRALSHTLNIYILFYLFVFLLHILLRLRSVDFFVPCALSNAEGGKSEMTTHKRHVDSPLITAITSLAQLLVDFVFYQKEEDCIH